MRNRLFKPLATLLALLLLSGFMPASGSSETVPGYLRLTRNQRVEWAALPATESETWLLPLTDTDAEGTESFNTLRLTPNSVEMVAADCPGQDCVGEGIVTFENRDYRILGNMIICLPHQLVVELFTPEEFALLNPEGTVTWTGQNPPATP